VGDTDYAPAGADRNLRRVSAQVAIDRINRDLANYWAKQMNDAAENNPKNLIFIIADMARSNPPIERAFVAEFIRQLRGKGPTLAQPLNWLEERLTENGQTSNELIQIENQEQAASQVSVSNSIGSLRLLGTIDWREFVEANSIIEQILREDKYYPLMDFPTRDSYRQSVERIAKNAEISEADVARIAIQLSQESAAKNDSTDRTAHVGYYLIGDGLLQTEKKANMRLSFVNTVRRAFGRYPLTAYIGSILLITFGITAALLSELYEDSPKVCQNLWLVLLVVLLSVICVSQLAVSLVNFLSTLMARPILLPRMGFSSGIPTEARTLVVIPSMLTNAEEVENLAEALEVRFLANKDEHLQLRLVN